MNDFFPKLDDKIFSNYEIHAFSNHGIVINISTMICYILMWFLIRIGYNNSNSIAIMRSLSIITLANFFCWLIPMFFPIFIIAPLKIPIFQAIIIANFVGLTIRLSGVLNGPILFICSKSEYRPIMKTELKRFYNNFMARFQHGHQQQGGNNSVAIVQVLPASIPQMNPSLRASIIRERISGK